MKKTIQTLFLLAAILSVVEYGCKSSQKTMLSGDYDVAIRKSVKKLRNNVDNEKHILILEEAYTKVVERDKSTIVYLKSEGSPESWVKIYDTYSMMKKRQEIIQPLVPLYLNSENRQAVLRFENYNSELIDAKHKAAAYLYAHAVKLLESEGRLNAREAYGELIRVKDMFANYKDVDEKIGKARFMGTNKALFRMVNETGVPLPPAFEKELTKISLHELNRKWLNYYTTYDENVFYDYSITVKMKLIDVGPELLKEIQYAEEKKVQDGWEYVLDNNGNVKKDTSGNDIKLPKYKILKANITETQQKKIARISGSVDYRNNRTKQLIKTVPITADAIFEHNAAIFNGDIEALKPETKPKLKNKPIPFPVDFELLFQAGNTLKPMVKEIVWANKGLIRE